MTSQQNPIRATVFGAAIGLFACVGAAPGAAVAQTSGAPANYVTLLGIPSATVAPGGTAFGALSLANKRIAPGPRSDGSLAFGLGLGSAEDSVGVQMTAHITSLTDSFGDSGYFEIKASRRIADGNAPTYLSFALSGAGYGDAKTRETAATVALTSFRQVRFSDGGDLYPVMFTLGAGTNRRNNESDAGIFGGVGIGVTPNMGLSAAWSGEYVNLGAAFRFDGFENFSVSAAVYDAFDQKDSRRIGVSFVYVLQDLF